MIFNAKKQVSWTDAAGEQHSVRAGRLECTMQVRVQLCMRHTIALRVLHSMLHTCRTLRTGACMQSWV